MKAKCLWCRRNFLTVRVDSPKHYRLVCRECCPEDWTIPPGEQVQEDVRRQLDHIRGLEFGIRGPLTT